MRIKDGVRFFRDGYIVDGIREIIEMLFRCQNLGEVEGEGNVPLDRTSIPGRWRADTSVRGGRLHGIGLPISC